MPFSLFIISNIILHSHMLPSFKRHQNTSQMLSGHKHPEQKSRGCWGSYPVPASTAFSKFSIIWTWGRKKMVKRGGRLDRQADIRTWQRQPERKTEKRETRGEKGCVQDSLHPSECQGLCWAQWHPRPLFSSQAPLPLLPCYTSLTLPSPKTHRPSKIRDAQVGPSLGWQWQGDVPQSNRVRNRLKKREHEKIAMGRRKGRERERQGDAETRMNLSGKPFSHYKVNLLGAGMGKVWEGYLPTLLHLRWGQTPWEVQWGPFLCPLLCN